MENPWTARAVAFVGALALGFLLAPAASAASTCSPDGLQDSGSIYRICMPDPALYNGKVVLWAHGFQHAGTPVQIPEDQLQLGSVSLPQIINGLGYGFATNSYSKTGLAVRQGMEDLVDLVSIYAQEQGLPSRVFLTGASEGGIITALLVEQHPEIFSGGVAACGPVGDFVFQINYFGDARAVFEYFYPGLIPGDPFHPSPELVSNWTAYYEDVVKPVVFHPANQHTLEQYVAVAKLPFDPDNYLATVEISVRDALQYSVVNLNDAAETLGGFPFGNMLRRYTGSDDDALLNALVPRVAADPTAIAEMRSNYATTGKLQKPLITLHTRRDQQVPYAHETMYALKTLINGSFLTRHLNIPIDRFEHCNFTVGEALAAFVLMLFYAGDVGGVDGVGSVLSGDRLAAFETLARQHGLPYSTAGTTLTVRPPRMR
jgi:pimeloyl-ACP methyl ester carboxylesterase